VKILALDTSTEACTAALLNDDQRINSPYVEFERGHAEHILPMIDALLASAKLRLADLDAIAFGRGPGGFTGVRLAASITQGLAFGSGTPVLPVSDLRAVAQQVLEADPTALTVVVCNDARMQEVYWGVFVRGASGLAELRGDERVSKPSEVTISPDVPTPIHGAGRGFRAYPDLTERLTPLLAAVHPALLPRAYEILRIAVKDFEEGRAIPAEQALPVYVRNDVARPPASRA
jgi:tRNA threonylcarbamoyladenosine biosynthesis protein TsaB